MIYLHRAFNSIIDLPLKVVDDGRIAVYNFQFYNRSSARDKEIEKTLQGEAFNSIIDLHQI